MQQLGEGAVCICIRKEKGIVPKDKSGSKGMEGHEAHTLSAFVFNFLLLPPRKVKREENNWDKYVECWAPLHYVCLHRFDAWFAFLFQKGKDVDPEPSCTICMYGERNCNV